MQVIVSYGRLGTKGKENITRLEDFKEAMKLAYRKIYEKKSEGFVSRSKTIDALSAFFREENEKKKRKIPLKKESKFSHKCNHCHNPIRDEVYKKIDQWAKSDRSHVVL